MEPYIQSLGVIPIFRPSFDSAEVKAVERVLFSGWVGLGPETDTFEKEFADYIGVKYAVGLNSCTAALHLALQVLDIGRGEVITTPMTFVATNHAILHMNAVPVFCDIDEYTLNLDVEKIEKLITPVTRAIMIMHYGGHACDMEPVLHLAAKHGLKVIEDCAHSCGGEYNGRKLGSIGDIGCFSFHAVKNLAAGDGGMITTNSKEVFERLKQLRWMGISKDTWKREGKQKEYDWRYDLNELGYKYHMNDITAAIGRCQLSKLNMHNKRRREIRDLYTQELHTLSEIKTPQEMPYAGSSCYSYVIQLSRRDKLNEYLRERGISSGVHYYPNHLYPLYEQYYRKLDVAEDVWKNVLTLPLFPDLSDEDVLSITQHIKEFCKYEYVCGAPDDLPVSV